MPYVCTPLGDFPPPTDDAESNPDRATLGAALQRMLPRGPLWRDPRQQVQPAFWRAVAEPFLAVFTAARDAARASTVVTAPVDSLDDWERDYGMPGPCMPPTADATLRRLRLRIARQPGGASAGYFICLAGRYGYAIDIEDGFCPFAASENGCGEAGLNDDEDLFIVTATVAGQVRWFAAGDSGCGEVGLGDFPVADDLECLIRRLKPAHCNVWFRYRRPSLDATASRLDATSLTLDHT